MTISRAFVKFLEDKGYGVFGQNIYLYRVPNSKKTEVELFYIIPSGGSVVSTNKTGESIRLYQMLVYFRSRKAERVDEVLSALADTLSCSSCVELEGFELVGIQATQFPTDQDTDAEDRMIGMVQCQLTAYKSCE